MASLGTERNLVFTSDLLSEVTNIEWNISNFPALTEIPGALKTVTLTLFTGEKIEMPSEWKFFLDRDGRQIGLYWQLEAADVNEIFVRVNAVILRSDGTAFQSLTSEMIEMKRRQSSGIDNIGTITTLLHPATNVLIDECLKIELKFEIYGSVVNRGTHASKVARLQELSFAAAAEDFAEAYKAGINSDATIVSKDGKQFPVHRLALEARSVIFAAVFMREKATGRVKINLSSRATEMIINHIYFGTLNNNWIEVAAEIIDAAEQLELMSLTEFCDWTLINACTLENAMQLLGIARRYKLDIAAADIAKYIRSNLETVLLACTSPRKSQYDK